MVAWYNYSWGNGDLEPMIQQWKTWWSHRGWLLLNTMNFILSHNASPWGKEHRQAFSIWDSLTVHVTPEGSGPDHFPTGLIIKQLLISIDCWAGEGPGERGAVGKLISKRVGNIFPWSEHKKRNKIQNWDVAENTGLWIHDAIDCHIIFSATKNYFIYHCCQLTCVPLKDILKS